MQKLSRNVAKLDTTALNKLVGEYYMAASAVEHLIVDGRRMKTQRPTRSEIKVVPFDKGTYNAASDIHIGLYPENIMALVSGRGVTDGISSVVQNAIDNDVYGKKSKKSYLTPDFFSNSSNSLVIQADNAIDKNAPGYFGYNRYYNVVSYLDGTTVTKSLDSKDAVVEYNNKISRSIYHKGDFLEIKGMEELDEASDERKLLQKRAGFEKGGVVKVTLNRYGIEEADALNDHAVLYISTDKLPDFLADNKVLGIKTGSKVKMTTEGRKIVNDLYTVDSDGKIKPIHKGSFDAAISKFTQNQKIRLDFERIFRAIDKNGYARVLQADAIQQMVFNIKQSVDIPFLEKFHKAIVDSGTSNNLAELQAVIDELRDNGRIDLNAVNRGLKSPLWSSTAITGSEPDLNSAADWLKIFSNNSGASRLNPSMVDHAFFLAENMEYGSRLAYIAKQVENIKGYEEKRIIGGLTSYEIMGSLLAGGDKIIRGLPTRAKSMEGSYYIRLGSPSKKRILRSNKSPQAMAGIEFNSSPEAVLENYQKMLEMQAAGDKSLIETTYGQRQLVHNFFVDVMDSNTQEGIFTPLFLDAASEAENEANNAVKARKARLLEIINANSNTPDKTFALGQEIIKDTINYRRQAGDKFAGTNPLVNPTAVNTILLKQADESFKKKVRAVIAKKNKSIQASYNLSDFMNPKGIEHFLYSDRLNEIYGPDQTVKMQQLFEAQRSALDKAAITISDFVRAHGGIIYTTEQGKVYAKFNGRPLRIDDKLPRFVSIGPAAYLRIGNSNYVADFDLDFFRNKDGSLSDTTAFKLKTKVEKAFGRYFTASKNSEDGKDSLSLADRMINKAALDSSLSKEEQFEAILKHTADIITSSPLQGQSPVHDINLNYAVSMRRLMADDYTKKQLKELLLMKKSVAESKFKDKIYEVVRWLDSGSEYLDVPTKNAVSNLILNGIIPQKAKYNNLYMPFSRDLKLTNAATNALYSLFPFGSTGTEMFDSLGRGISFVDSDTIKWAKKHFVQKVSKSRLKKQLLKDSNTLLHEQQIYAAADDVFGETVSHINTVHLEATQNDVDKLSRLIDEKLREKGYSDELRQEVIDRFKLRTQIFEGGGSISGRLLSSIGYRQGDNLIDVTNKDLTEDTRWGSTAFKLKLDKDGKVIGFKYNKGYIVPKGESFFNDYSLYGDAFNKNTAQNAMVVRRKIASQGKKLLEEGEVLDTIKKLAGDTGKGISEEDFYRVLNSRLRVVAEASDIKNTGAVKLLSDVSEKHIAQINEDNLGFAARVSGKDSALYKLLESDEFKALQEEVKAAFDVDIADDRLSYEVIEDLASGKFNHEIWAELKARKDANLLFIQNAVKNANKVVKGETRLKDQVENIFFIPDLVKEITGADVINLELADSVKHKTNSLLRDTWEGIVSVLGNGKTPGPKTYEKALEEMRQVFFGSGSVYEKDGSLIINSFDQENFGYKPEALLALRKKYNLGETISGDFYDDEGKLVNALKTNIEGEGRSTSFLLKNSPVQFIHDAYNFLNRPRWGLREQLSLNNDIVYSEGLGIVENRMGRSGLKEIFEEIFGDVAPDINGYLTWQRQGYNNQSAGTLLIKHAALWSPKDKMYLAGNSGKTWLEKRKRQTYLALVNHKVNGITPFQNAAIGEKFIEDVTLANEGMTALLLQNEFEIGEKTGDKKLLERLNEKFGVKSTQFLTPEDINTHFEDMLSNILANGETDPSLIWGRNSIVELYKDGDVLEEVLGPEKKYIAIPAAALKSVMEGSNTLAAPKYQRKAAGVIDDIVKLKKIGTLGDGLSKEQQLEKERLLKALPLKYDEYVAELREYFGSKKSAANYDWLSPQVEFGARMKTQVFDVAQVIAGDAPDEVNNFTFNGRSYKELMLLDGFDGISDKVQAFRDAQGKALPSFAIASTYDLEKFGYGDDYFEELGKVLGLTKEDIKQNWLKRAQSEGIEVVVNRSPSDYKHSSNVSRLFFTDKFGPGIVLTDSITAAKMKNDSDGDTSLQAMLGVRSSFAKNYGKWLDLNTFSVVTDNGANKSKVALLEKEYGKETIAELFELKKAYDISYNYDAYYKNFDFLSEGSSIENYEQFLSQGYEKVREKSILAAQRKYFMERAVAGRIYGFRKNTFSDDELKRIEKEWSAAQKAIGGVIKGISESKAQAAKLAERAIISRIEDIGPTFVSYKKGKTDTLAKLWGKMLESGNDNERAVLGSLILSSKELRSIDGIIPEKMSGTIEQGIKSKTEYLNLVTEFALKNNQTGVGEIDPGLFAIDIAANEYARKNPLTEIERSSISYLRESAKEGFLTTKKGEFSITEREKMSGELKDYIAGIIKYQGNDKKTEEYAGAVEGLRNLMKTKGLEVIKRNPGFGDMTHGEIIDTAISTLEKAVSVIPKEFRYSPSAASSLYLNPLIDKMYYNAATAMNSANSYWNSARIISFLGFNSEKNIDIDAVASLERLGNNIRERTAAAKNMQAEAYVKEDTKPVIEEKAPPAERETEARIAGEPLESLEEQNIAIPSESLEKQSTDAPIKKPLENENIKARPAIISAVQPEPKPAIETRKAEEKATEMPVSVLKADDASKNVPQPKNVSSEKVSPVKKRIKAQAKNPAHNAKAKVVTGKPKSNARQKNKNNSGKRLAEKAGTNRLDWIERTIIPKLGGWNKVALGVAGGIIGAGYIGGNPSTPSGYEAGNYISEPQQPVYADKNIVPARLGSNQEGYIVNINARAANYYGDNRVQNIIGSAVTNTYSNNTVTINTNINHREDYMSAQDLYDYLALSL